MHSVHNQFPVVFKIGHFLLNLMTCQKNKLHTECPEKKGVDSEGGFSLHDISTGAPRSGECWGSKQSQMLSSKRNQWGSDLRPLTLEQTGNLLFFFSSGDRKAANTVARHSQVVPAMSDQMSDTPYSDYWTRKFEFIPTYEYIFWLSSKVIFHLETDY